MTVKFVYALIVIVQVFDGNVDSYHLKHAYLDEPIIARYVKFHTVSWHRHPSMRVEIIGCQGQSVSQRRNLEKDTESVCWP